MDGAIQRLNDVLAKEPPTIPWALVAQATNEALSISFEAAEALELSLERLGYAANHKGDWVRA
ncbi:MAG TPA: hypothetical protein V6D47_15605 [Oscillatoriaceae cyanobacterium]